MKLITAVIKPFKLDDVKDAIRAVGVVGRSGSVRASSAPTRSDPSTRRSSSAAVAQRCCSHVRSPSGPIVRRIRGTPGR
jgi:hypothetical protein